MAHHMEFAMNGLGWIFMLGAWIVVIGLNFFCFYRILRKRS